MSSKSKNMSNQEFTGIRSVLWPIHNSELKKFIPMSLMMLCTLFIYTFVRGVKDTLMISECSAATIPMVKICWVLPLSVVSVAIFAKLCNKFDEKKLFNMVVIFFLLFFAVFAFILLPLKNVLHLPQSSIDFLTAKVPFLGNYWPSIGKWTFSLYYVMAELWGSLVLSALFWGFANKITKRAEAKRHYSLFGMVGNIGLLLCPAVTSISEKLASFVKSAFNIADSYTAFTMVSTLILIVFGLILIWLYNWMQANVLTDPKLYCPDEVKTKKKKAKMGVGESLKYIITSPYFLMIAFLLIGYGVSINLTELVWKDQQGLLFNGDKNAIQNFQTSLAGITGVATIVIMLIGVNILSRCKWKTSALVTPLFFLIVSTLFFLIVIYQNKVGKDAMIFGSAILNVAVYVGLAEISAAKGVKYSLFDATKNMAYMPVDPDVRSKGQAAVEVIGGRFGKAAGAIIGSTVLMIVSAIQGVSADKVRPTEVAIILGAITVVVLALWIISVCSMSKKYEKMCEENELASTKS